MADGVSFSIDVGVQAAGADSAAASLDKLTQKLTGAGDAAPKATKAFEALDSVVKDSGEKAEGGEIKLKKLSGALGSLGGPLGQAGQKATAFADNLQDMVESLGAAGGIAAVTILVVALSAALVAGTVAVVAWSIGLSDAARSSALLSDGIAGSVAGGRELDATVHALGAKVPQTREELLKMAGDLRRSGLEGAALSSALETTATKAAQLKWGPDFAKQTLSLSNQAIRLKENISSIFGGLKLDALLKGLGEIVKLFDANEASGRAVKVVFESIFQPIVDGITKVIPKIIGWVLQVEIWMLKAAIAVKPFVSKIEELGLVLLVAVAVVVGPIVAAFVLFSAVTAAVAVAIGLLVLGIVWLGEQAVAAGKVIVSGLVDGWNYVTAKFQEVLGFFQSFSLFDIGSQMINGLVEGIKAAAGGILTAMTGAVTGAIDGAKNLLGIHSPSKVFAEIGVNTGAGMAQGVDASADKVQGALEGMVAPPSLEGIPSPATSPAATPAAAPAKGKDGGGASFQGAVFNLYGVEGAEDAEARIGALLTRLIEGDMSQLGGAVPA